MQTETGENEKPKPVRPNIRELMRAKMREQQQEANGNANTANGDDEVVIMCKPRQANNDQNESGDNAANQAVNENGQAPDLVESQQEDTGADSDGLEPSEADQVDGVLLNGALEPEAGDFANMYSAGQSGVTFPRRPQTLAPGSGVVRSQIDKFSVPSPSQAQTSPSPSAPALSPSGARSGSYAAPSAANLTPSPSTPSNGTPFAHAERPAAFQNGDDYDELVARARAQAERELAAEFAATRREQDAALARLENENRILQAQAEQVQHANEELRFVIAAYDEQIAKLERSKNASVEESKRRLQSVEAQRDQAISEVLSLEKAFSDLHRRLEVSKHCLTQQVDRERQQSQQLEEALQRVKRWEAKYVQLKQHAEEKLSLANREIEKVRKHSSAELVGLEALVKKLELERSSVSEALARKSAEVDELHKICDELLMKLNQRDIP